MVNHRELLHVPQTISGKRSLYALLSAGIGLDQAAVDGEN